MKLKINENNAYHILICGGRTELDYSIVDNFISSVLDELNIEDCEIISGGCKGADKSGEKFAEINGFKIVQFLPDWKKFGKAAGIKRNAEMINYIKQFDNSIVIAFWNGESHGTKFTIEQANKNNIPVYICSYTNTVLEGVTFNKGIPEVDFKSDTSDDIFHLVNTKTKHSTFNHFTYYYGYKVENSKKKNKEYHALLNYLKEHSEDEVVKQLIDKSVSSFYEQVSDIDCIICMESHSNINSYITTTLSDNYKCSVVPVNKNDPSLIKFNWDKFNKSFTKDAHYYNKMVNYINNLMKIINSSSNFSLTKQVLPRYRKYIENFLTILDTDLAFILSCKNILIVDDIISTGSTVSEILNVLNNIGYVNNVYIFSLVNNR